MRRHTRPSKLTALLALLAVATTLVIARNTRQPDPGATEANPPVTARFDQPEPAVQGETRELLPVTQPTPVPAHDWPGWNTYPRGRCAWLPQHLLNPLQPAHPPQPDGTTCTVDLTSGVRVVIKWGWPVSKILWSPFSTNASITIAGLPARRDELDLVHGFRAGACQISVHTHALTGFSVLAWRTADLGHPAPARCDDAVTAADLVARTFVAAAGGTPWSATPQRPTPTAIAHASACELLADGATWFGLDSAGPTPELTDDRDICTYRHRDTEITLDLARRPYRPPSHSTPRRAVVAGTELTFARLPARQETFPSGCAISVMLTPSHVVRATYRSTTHTQPCVAAELIAAQAMTALLDHGSP